MRTLVVEDDPIAAEANAGYVRRVAGFEVVGVVGSAADALRAVAATPVDLLLLDVHLPDGNGLDVLRRLRSTGRTVDAIMVTRARDLAVVQAAVAFGATQYLVKPFTAAVVRTKLEAHREYRARLGAGAPVVAQGDVDELLGAVRGGAVPVGGLPKGISRESLDAVVRALAGAGPTGLTASEVGALLGTSRITARRYLEHIAETGLAVRHARYGSTGRPQVEYRAQPGGVAG
ncbi:response regulator [Pseudonocardia sp. S2-4]|uniref:Transcriptional regulatory protein n=1 Tax=Pseudonocardia humida TaxID=2800819 RepID=A0ABT1A1W9_9PSEU|nr:response regulator [Pseudonocardia humida]